MRYILFLLLLNNICLAADETFNARINITLCTDYNPNTTSLEFKYREENSSSLKNLEVIDQKIYTSSKWADITAKLPATLGKSKFFIVSFCKNSFGSSVASNEASISYCDYLKKKDSDQDGLSDGEEDTNCNNTVDSEDYSNPFLVDSDLDGIKDLIEKQSSTNPRNPASSPRPLIISSAPFDPDQNGSSNPIVWRSANALWLIKDYQTTNNTLQVTFGNSTDIPFLYQPDSNPSDFGTISFNDSGYHWNFHGVGFKKASGIFETEIIFGQVGDLIIPGSWEDANITNPGIAKFSNNSWIFSYYSKSGLTVSKSFGTKGDIPKIQDYDADGKLDLAVFRPDTLEIIFLQSSNNQLKTINGGSVSAVTTVTGDFSADNKNEITFWEANTSTFNSLRSETNFSTNVLLQLGSGSNFIPLNWNYQNSRSLYTVVDHSQGLRIFYLNNQPSSVQQILWGIPGDHQG